MFVAAPLVYTCNAVILHTMMFLAMGRLMLSVRMLDLLFPLRVTRIQLLKGMLQEKSIRSNYRSQS